MQSIFSDHNGTNLEITERSLEKSPNIWKINNTFLNNPWRKEEIKGENKVF